jgi:hypothetical protein
MAELLPESDFSERQLDDRLAAGTLENVISLFWVDRVSSGPLTTDGQGSRPAAKTG